MQTKRSEIIVGLVIIVAIVIVIVGNVVISGKKSKIDMYEVTVIFPKIGGLDVGNPVFIHGVRSGKVADIALQQDDVLVKLLINRVITLKKDAWIEISERGMMGEREISIEPGKLNEKLDVSKPIQGFYTIGFNETITKVGETVKNINVLSASLEKIIGDENEIENLRTALHNFNQLLDNVNHILENNKDISIEYDRINNILTNLDSLISRNDEKVDRIISFADERLDSLDQMLEQGHELLARLQNEDSNLSRFTENDSLYQKLNSSLDKFDALITDIKENPKKYFSLF